MSYRDQTDLVIDTAHGTVRGVRRGGSRAWLGIHYAASTSGENRWQAPQPAPEWQGIRDSREFGSIAPQPTSRATPVLAQRPQSEECLSLNIWAPSDPSDSAPLPVLVWVHGGGYIIGASSLPVYEGATLADRGDVVVVTINYRLGPLGFLDFSFLKSDGSEFQTNLGLRDIVAALQWVRENIAAFGGNPDDVTVFGQSAGAASITSLMTAPAARGLFHKAIAQSPPATSVYDPERAQRLARQYLDLLNMPLDRAARLLREQDAQALVRDSMRLLDRTAERDPGILAFAPVVDGEFLPEHPADVFVRGGQHPVPLLIGSTANEAALFKFMGSPLMPTDSDSVERMFDALLEAQPDIDISLDRIRAAYPGYPRRSAAIHISSDAGIGMPVSWMADAHARVAPTHVYRFEHATPMLRLMGLGAMHASDIPYVFGTLPARQKLDRQDAIWLGGLGSAKRVSANMQSEWLHFARSGAPRWPRYDSDRRATMVFGSHAELMFDPTETARSAWGSRVLRFP